MLDLTTVDSLKDTTTNFDEIIDFDEYKNIRDQVFYQITEFENLGIDLLKNVDDKFIKKQIFTEIIDYVNENYVDIADIDNIMISDNFIHEIGYYIYLFFAVDCFNSILPNFITICGITSYNDFEKYIQKHDQTTIKSNTIKAIEQIISPLINLQNIDPSVNKDIKYKAFLKRLTYEVDLIEYGDLHNFTHYFTREVLRKNFPQIIWRAL